METAPTSSGNSRLTASQVKMNIAKPVHARLTALKMAQRQAKGREVSFSEVIEELLNKAERMEQQGDEQG